MLVCCCSCGFSFHVLFPLLPHSVQVTVERETGDKVIRAAALLRRSRPSLGLGVWFVTITSHTQPASLSHSLLEFTVIPQVFLFLALPWEVIVILTTFHEGDEQMSTIIPQIEGNLGLSQLLLCHLHL